MFIIEDYEVENPNWDRSTDTLDTLDLELHTSVTRAMVVGAAALVAR